MIRFENLPANSWRKAIYLFLTCSISKCLRFVQKKGFVSKVSWINAYVSAKSLKIKTLSSVFSQCVNIWPNNWILKSFRILFGLNFDLVQMLAPTFDLNFDLVKIWTKIFEKTFDLVKHKTWFQIFDLTFDLVQKLTFDQAYLKPWNFLSPLNLRCSIISPTILHVSTI